MQVPSNDRQFLLEQSGYEFGKQYFQGLLQENSFMVMWVQTRTLP